MSGGCLLEGSSPKVDKGSVARLDDSLVSYALHVVEFSSKIEQVAVSPNRQVEHDESRDCYEQAQAYLGPFPVSGPN
jgi:hypothetical protein